MSKPSDTYIKHPLCLTLEDLHKYAATKEYSCVEIPLLNVLLDHIVIDELHLLLRFTDVLLSNLLIPWNWMINMTILRRGVKKKEPT